jgi:hypothetical protein
MTELMALQRYLPNPIKAYKQYARLFLKAISDYTFEENISVTN